MFANEILVCFLFPIHIGVHRVYHLFTTVIHNGMTTASSAAHALFTLPLCLLEHTDQIHLYIWPVPLLTLKGTSRDWACRQRTWCKVRMEHATWTGLRP